MIRRFCPVTCGACVSTASTVTQLAFRRDEAQAHKSNHGRKPDVRSGLSEQENALFASATEQ